MTAEEWVVVEFMADIYDDQLETEDVGRVIGPFATREAASQWASQHLATPDGPGPWVHRRLTPPDVFR